VLDPPSTMMTSTLTTG
nr:immunoglobulin heavy chain junction region [Mus musculus]